MTAPKPERPAEIPAEDWVSITTGARDADEVHRARKAYELGVHNAQMTIANRILADVSRRLYPTRQKPKPVLNPPAAT